MNNIDCFIIVFHLNFIHWNIWRLLEPNYNEKVVEWFRSISAFSYISFRMFWTNNFQLIWNWFINYFLMYFANLVFTTTLACLTITNHQFRITYSFFSLCLVKAVNRRILCLYDTDEGSWLHYNTYFQCKFQIQNKFVGDTFVIIVTESRLMNWVQLTFF